MTPDEIKSHPVFDKLTESQQVFVVTLIENKNDRVAAAHKAWKCKSDDSARALASRTLKNPNVNHLVEAYFGLDPERVQFSRESALEFAAQKARTAGDEKVALEYFKLIIEMNGWRVKPADNDVTDEKIDDSNVPFAL